MKTRSSRNVVVSVLVTLALTLGLVSVAFADNNSAINGQDSVQIIAGGGTSTTNGAPATSWQLGANGGSAKGMAVDSAGNLYIGNNSVILRLDLRTGLMSTVAGQSTPGYSNGAALSAQFQGIAALATDELGNVYIAEGKYVYPTTTAGNARIRVFNVASGQVYTLAGSGSGVAGAPGDGGLALGAQLNNPSAPWWLRARTPTMWFTSRTPATT